MVSLPEDSGAEEEEETGGASTGLVCTTAGTGEVEETAADVMTGEGISGAAAVVEIGATVRSCCIPAPTAHDL